jgi:hypothetical protein
VLLLLALPEVTIVKPTEVSSGVPTWALVGAGKAVRDGNRAGTQAPLQLTPYPVSRRGYSLAFKGLASPTYGQDKGYSWTGSFHTLTKTLTSEGLFQKVCHLHYSLVIGRFEESPQSHMAPPSPTIDYFSYLNSPQLTPSSSCTKGHKENNHHRSKSHTQKDRPSTSKHHSLP